MSGFVSSLVSSRSFVAAASLSDRTVDWSMWGVSMAGCCSIMRQSYAAQLISTTTSIEIRSYRSYASADDRAARRSPGDPRGRPPRVPARAPLLPGAPRWRALQDVREPVRQRRRPDHAALRQGPLAQEPALL